MKKFLKSRRSATAVIFAVCLLPLVLMVALAIDFTFFTEARSQVQIAADAAATHAVRAAEGTYALESSQGVAVATAQSDAKTAGNQAGLNWFNAQLGHLPTASVPTNPTVDTELLASGNGFTASVTFAAIYPPFFDRLFATSANWNIDGKSSASAQYNYVEILMMLDASQSMLIGADPSDIVTMEDNSVCMSPTYVSITGLSGDNPMLIPGLPGTTSTPKYGSTFTNGGLLYQYTVADGDGVNFASPNIAHYTNSSGNSGNYDDVNGSCKSGYQEPYFNPINSPGNTGGAGVPCAFACHYSSQTAPDGLPMDLYGQARRDGAKLRLDSVLQATEEVISSMINSESANDEFSIGLYKFNTDVAPLYTGTTGGGTGVGDPNYEATYNLNTVLSTVQSIDYSYAPETKFPPVDTVDDGNTDFPTSMADFLKGNATKNTPIIAAGSGSTPTTPLKDLFIVTDGMNDTCGPNCGATRTMGEMTGIKAEAGTGMNTAVCQPFKNKGFHIYVLYVTYNPVPHITYYLPYKTEGYSSPSNSYVNEDFPTLQNGAEADYDGTTTANKSVSPNMSPNVAALQACASTVDGTVEFYTATTSADIAKQMGNMLSAALGSGIQVTN